MPDKYELVGTYKNDNERYCCTVRMFSPIISEEEREHRKDEIKKTTANYMAEVYKIRLTRDKMKQAE